MLNHQNIALSKELFLQKNEIDKLKEENAKFVEKSKEQNRFVLALSNSYSDLFNSLNLLLSSINTTDNVFLIFILQSNNLNIFSSYISSVEANVDQDTSSLGDIEINKYENVFLLYLISLLVLILQLLHLVIQLMYFLIIY